MSDAFDGAGKPFSGPSFKAGILILLALIVASFIIWNLVSWGMELLDFNGPQGPMMPQVP